MIRSPTASRRTRGSRLQRLRQRAGLTRAALAQISGVDLGFIRALENDTLCQLISIDEIQHALDRLDGCGPQRLMRRTLLRWAGDLHRLADALADNFENLFPAADLAALSDQLWLKIQSAQPAPSSLENPWHDWGWFRNVALSDDLPDETVEEQFEACDLQPIIRDLLAGLEPHEQSVITLRYGLAGPSCTLAEIAQQLGLTGRRVNQIEQNALHYLKHPQSRLRRRSRLN